MNMALDQIALIITTLAVVFSAVLNAALWRRIGRMEEAMKNICPWGKNNCPSFKRASVEAAPVREVTDP